MHPPSPLFAISPIDDQALAGALMWVFGSFVYLIPAVVITLQMLSPQGSYSHNLSNAQEIEINFSVIAAEPPITV